MMSYQQFRDNLVGTITAYVADLDEVFEDTSLSLSDNLEAFNKVSKKHGMPSL